MSTSTPAMGDGIHVKSPADCISPLILHPKSTESGKHSHVVEKKSVKNPSLTDCVPTSGAIRSVLYMIALQQHAELSYYY